jgi:hypothetical protein
LPPNWILLLEVGGQIQGNENIVAEGADMIEEEADDEVKDARLIAAAQRAYRWLMRGRGRRRLCGRSRHTNRQL